MDKPKICVSCVPALFSTNLQQCFLKDFRICSVVQMTGALVSSAKEMGRISVLLSVFTFYPRFGSYCEYRCFSNCVSEPWHTEPLGDFIYKSRINILLTGFFWSFSLLSVLNVTWNASANWHCKLKINKDHSKLVLVLWWVKTSLEHLGWFAIAVSDLLLPWVICFGRGWFAFVESDLLLSWRERFTFAASEFAFTVCDLLSAVSGMCFGAVNALLLSVKLWATVHCSFAEDEHIVHVANLENSTRNLKLLPAKVKLLRRK